MAKNRTYSCKDVDMLLAAQTIAESFKTNMPELSEVRTDWTTAYANELVARIEQTTNTFFGIDAQKNLREATAALIQIQAPAMHDVSFLKTQIEDDFKKEPAKLSEMLITLGFANNFKQLQKGNQEALIQCLFKFKQNLSEPLRQEIEAKGTSPKLIDRILGYADTMLKANVTQESFKSTTKEVTKDVTEAFNAIYDEVIGICKKAKAYYVNQPLKKEQFSFSNVLAKMGATSKNTKPKTDKDQPE